MSSSIYVFERMLRTDVIYAHKGHGFVLIVICGLFPRAFTSWGLSGFRGEQGEMCQASRSGSTPSPPLEKGGASHLLLSVNSAWSLSRLGNVSSSTIRTSSLSLAPSRSGKDRIATGFGECDHVARQKDRSLPDMKLQAVARAHDEALYENSWGRPRTMADCNQLVLGMSERDLVETATHTMDTKARAIASEPRIFMTYLSSSSFSANTVYQRRCAT